MVDKNLSKNTNDQKSGEQKSNHKHAEDIRTIPKKQGDKIENKYRSGR